MTTPTPTTAAPAPKPLTIVDKQRITLRRLFDQQKPELAKILPRSMDPERLFRMALTECIKNQGLLKCSAESWALAIQICGAQGLYPDSGLGLMYLIPRENSKKIDNQWIKVWEVTAQRGYQGDIALARKSGEIADIYAEVVYEKDDYKVVKGLSRDIHHIPYDGEDEPGALKACYAVARLKSGETAFVTLSKRDVLRHKAAAFGTDKDVSPWNKHEAAMWRKTAIHELFKWLPKATESMENAARAIATDGDGRAIETTAIDLGRVELPASTEQRTGMDALADRLEGERAAQEGTVGEEPTPRNCPHPEITTEKLAALAPGKSLVCGDCGEEVRPDREPGSDDEEPTPEQAVKAIAATAAPEQVRGPRRTPPVAQGKLTE